MPGSVSLAGSVALAFGASVLLALPFGALPTSLAAQAAPEKAGESGITGFVLVRSEQEPAIGAHILIDGESTARTDGDGEFLVLGLRAGVHRFSVRYRGTDSNSLEVDLAEGEVLRFDVLFEQLPGGPGAGEDQALPAETSVPSGTPEYEIPALTAEVAGTTPAKMRGFEERRRGGGPGRFVTRSDIEEARVLFPSDLINGFAGVRVRRSPLGPEITMRRGGARCTPTLFIDGSPTRSIMMDDYGTEHVEAIEVYTRPLEVPPGYQDRDRGDRFCGVILLWTRERRP